jgi:hypothetical protein
MKTSELRFDFLPRLFVCLLSSLFFYSPENEKHASFFFVAITCLEFSLFFWNMLHDNAYFILWYHHKWHNCVNYLKEKLNSL